MAKTTRKKKKSTPLMTQYNTIKGKYPDAILLFRVGDFYETFGQDAIETAGALGITLTKRHNGAASEIELAGFPHHALETYLPKLIRAGYRVAICDQLEDPKKTKKLVKRGVVELVTPGIALNEKMLDHKVNNYLAALYFDKKEIGAAFLDASTGEFFVAQGSAEYIDKLLQSLTPSEIIYSKAHKKRIEEYLGDRFYLYPLEEWIFAPDFTRDKLLLHFKTQSLKGYGIEDLQSASIAAGSIIHYLQETQHQKLQHISSISRIKEDRYVWLDRFTIRNLELLYSMHEKGTCLIDIMDHTTSPMGGRLLKKWVVLPLRNQREIEQRLSMVGYLLEKVELREDLIELIKQMGDLERLIARVPMARINPRQVVQIKKALKAIIEIKKLCMESEDPNLQKLGDQLNLCQVIRDKIEVVLMEEPSAMVSKGNVIAEGVSEELDELRHLQQSGKDFLVQMQQRESEATGITSLKIGFNNVFGYYLEVRNRFKDQVPDTWLRKQTLVSSERYITAELKKYEEKIFGAEEKILSLETQLFEDLVLSLQEYIRPIQLNASLVARLDCLLCFAQVAEKNNYCRPTIDESLRLEIKAGRHPVIEKQLPAGDEYVPNDIVLDSEEEQIFIITGPNMSGKSALLRQTALIVLMAQMGSFVPAASAQIGLVDKVFTRVGASDNISSGESTFMVEMNETASIMNNISPRSLILLDEIGRGTSTYDGISIAWALAEHLHEHKKARPKTLFATHYHELTELSNNFERIKNYSIATKEVDNKVVFLRRLIPQATKKSFGIHVAEMAGMPKSIVKRANEILAELEQKSISNDLRENLRQLPKAPTTYQMSIFEVDGKMSQARRILESLDVNTLTPVEALLKLQELQELFKKG